MRNLDGEDLRILGWLKFGFTQQQISEKLSISRSSVVRKITQICKKLNLEINWFKEKRKCSSSFINNPIPLLESICVYCNRVFNNNEPIPCKDGDCIHIFCSIKCVNNHYRLKHKKFTNQ